MTPSARRDPEILARFAEAYQRARELSASLAGPSLAEQLVELGARDPSAFAAILDSLPPLDRVCLLYAWAFWARPKQRPAALPKHRILAWIAARGLGKSRAAAERVRERVEAGSMSGAITGPTLDDIERYCIGGMASDASRRNGGRGMVPSHLRIGILDVFPPHQRPEYDEKGGRVLFHTGAVYYLVSARTPEFRGGNVDTVWFEEASSNKIARSNRVTLLSNAELALRARGPVSPEMIITCTPTPDPWLKELVGDPGCVTILGETEENASNLDEDYQARLKAKFGNSRQGRQEVKGEILGDGEGTQLAATVTNGRRFSLQRIPPMKRIALAIDPAISVLRGTDPTGIVGGGRGVDDELYLFFAREGKWSPREWAEILLDVRVELGAEAIVGERNRGGDLVKSNVQLVAELRAQRLGTIAAVKVVEVHASSRTSKGGRLEELETLGEQGRVHLPEEGLPEYEDQATTWVADSGMASPNLLDAAGWLAFYLYDGWGEAAGAAAAAQCGIAADMNAALTARLHGRQPEPGPQKVDGAPPGDARYSGPAPRAVGRVPSWRSRSVF